ncbi:hypothetical protein [Thomasclavelia cocleata]|uniref:Replication terminator protein n=1 Tax=Clostridium cadaveris TaxID=1529 RepID=A0A316M9G4_9CLOT|nr:hypothetical protein [Thomasclavelia cocleata]PWL55157.1 MAG: hypothetical protein DBY38_02480 [Clostridium cadaveris]
MNDELKVSDVKELGILGVQDGQLLKNVAYELDKVVNNINDINTDDKPREIAIKIKIIPIKDKKQLVVTFTTTSKLRPLNKIETNLFNMQKVDNTTGVVTNMLQEITDVAVGQLNIDGEVQEAPKPIMIGID